MKHSDQEKHKRAAAEAAYEYIVEGDYIGVGTGSTVNHFIDVLSERKPALRGCVASSSETRRRLLDAGFEVEELNNVGSLPVYFDSADEINPNFAMIKGGGGALTWEKIIAGASRTYVCMVDESKRVRTLGKKFPLPVEVIEMGRSAAARKLVALHGTPELRKGFMTDNGHQILDVYGLDLSNAIDMEYKIRAIPGVVAVGLFAHRPADILVAAGKHGVEIIKRPRVTEHHPRGC